tara:strand:+ start:1 stop:807 length:807 start_codon:yes stop_codon:yes gene_type:complete
MAAFLDKEPESRKEQAISLAQKHGFKVKNIDINTSTSQWEISEDGKTLLQPFTSIKGLGDKAIEQIVENRPFNSIEELLFNEDVVYSKLNKRALHALCLSGALDSLCDDRFNGCKHFWMACVEDRPKNEKKLLENIKKYDTEADFSVEDKIEHVTTLTGMFPFSLVMTKSIKESISRYAVPAIGSWDKDLGVAWFITREVIPKRTKTGKPYWILKVIDDQSNSVSIKCWGVKPEDSIHINRPYAAKLDHSEDWGFSTRSVKHNFRLLG